MKYRYKILVLRMKLNWIVDFPILRTFGISVCFSCPINKVGWVTTIDPLFPQDVSEIVFS